MNNYVDENPDIPAETIELCMQEVLTPEEAEELDFMFWYNFYKE